MTPNKAIANMTAETSVEHMQNLVTEWCNASEVEIDQGNIWIANPQRGHWLDVDSLAEFVAWCERPFMIEVKE